jgi:hypothetical protein
MAISSKHNIQADHAVLPGYMLGISHKIDVEMVTGSTQNQSENHRRVQGLRYPGWRYLNFTT